MIGNIDIQTIDCSEFVVKLGEILDAQHVALTALLFVPFEIDLFKIEQVLFIVSFSLLARPTKLALLEGASKAVARVLSETASVGQDLGQVNANGREENEEKCEHDECVRDVVILHQFVQSF